MIYNVLDYTNYKIFIKNITLNFIYIIYSIHTSYSFALCYSLQLKLTVEKVKLVPLLVTNRIHYCVKEIYRIIEKLK